MFEKYSREGYEDQQKKVEEAEKKFEESGGTSSVQESVEKYGYPGQPPESLVPEIRLERAKQKLEKLKNVGHAEALKLNEEYDELRKRVEDANTALRNFEKEKLGM